MPSTWANTRKLHDKSPKQPEAEAEKDEGDEDRDEDERDDDERDETMTSWIERV